MFVHVRRFVKILSRAHHRFLFSSLRVQRLKFPSRRIVNSIVAYGSTGVPTFVPSSPALMPEPFCVVLRRSASLDASKAASHHLALFLPCPQLELLSMVSASEARDRVGRRCDHELQYRSEVTLESLPPFIASTLHTPRQRRQLCRLVPGPQCRRGCAGGQGIGAAGWTRWPLP